MQKQSLWWMIGVLALVIGSVGLAPRVADAQGNLLINGSLERPYYGQGAATRTAPQGWQVWVGAGAPEAFPHTDKVQVRDGEVSWNFKQGFTAFTAAGYQQVSGLNEGDVVRASAYGWVYTCNDTSTSCVIPDPPYRRSDTSASASLKVGIDPTGGTNPLAETVQWSAGAAPYDQWIEMSVVAESAGSTVTVFLYMSQGAGLALNNVYWDQASLVLTDDVPNPADAPPTAAEVPFVVPQNVQPDGSILHTVQEGDTLSSIVYAYRDYEVTLESIAEINEGIQPNTRFLQLGQQILILPPGSLDPTTGQRLAPGTTLPTPTTTAAEGDALATAEVDVDAEDTTTGATTATPPPTPGAVQSMSDLPRPGSAAESTEEASDEAVETQEVAMAPSPTPTVEATPVAVADAPVDEATGLLRTTGTLCVAVYDDANTNMTRDEGEPLLAGAGVSLAQPGSTDTVYDVEEGDPACFDLAPGRYDVSAVLPENYGATTAGSAAVLIVRGREARVDFGGAEGYTPPAVAEAAMDDTAPDAADNGAVIEQGAVAPMVEVTLDEDAGEKSAIDRLYDNSGLFVLGLAGVVAVSGMMLLLLLRRFSA